jgi:hypothetical protein
MDGARTSDGGGGIGRGRRPGKRQRRSDEPVAIGEIMDGLMNDEVLSRGIPLATLVTHWPQIVGERLAAEITPLSLEAGVLTVGAGNGPWGAQARFLHEEIQRKAAALLGGDAVTSVRVVVRKPR